MKKILEEKEKIKKIRRRLEDRIRKADASLILRLAKELKVNTN